MKTVTIRPRFGKGLIAGVLPALVAAAGSAAGFMKIQGIDGPSTSPGKAGWIDVKSHAWGTANPGAAAQTKRAGGGCRYGHLRVVKMIDKASPGLARLGAGKRRFPFLELDLGLERHRLEDVLVTSVKPAGSAKGGESVPLEEVSFNYSKCSYHYLEQKETGKPKGTPSYDVKQEP